MVFGFDRQGWITLLAALLLALITLFTSYDHVDIPGVATALPLPQQGGIPCIVAALATAVGESQLASTVDKKVERYAIQQRTKQIKIEIEQIKNETERLRSENERLRNERAQRRKEDERLRKEDERMRREDERMRKEDERLAAIDAKISALLHSLNSSSTPAPTKKEHSET